MFRFILSLAFFLTFTLFAQASDRKEFALGKKATADFANRTLVIVKQYLPFDIVLNSEEIFPEYMERVVMLARIGKIQQQQCLLLSSVQVSNCKVEGIWIDKDKRGDLFEVTTYFGMALGYQSGTVAFKKGAEWHPEQTGISKEAEVVAETIEDISSVLGKFMEKRCGLYIQKNGNCSIMRMNIDQEILWNKENSIETKRWGGSYGIRARLGAYY